MLDSVTPADLEGLYALADAFAFPSLYEGFGLPVLEAMSRGVPVACSDRGSLGEVAGQAAELFDPESPPSIAAAVERVLADPAHAEELRRCVRWFAVSTMSSTGLSTSGNALCRCAA